MLRFADGRLYDSENFITDVPEDTAETLAELIRSFYMIRDFVPRRVSVDGEVADSELLERWLSEKKGKKVIISYSTAGEQKKLFEMCRSNAAQYLTPLTGTAGRKTAALDELADPHVGGVAEADHEIIIVEPDAIGGIANLEPKQMVVLEEHAGLDRKMQRL